MVQSTPRAPVMYDVARLAGVSHQTVSRVLNGYPNVRAATRERVLEAMRQLDYRPNALARGLASRRSRTIGVVSYNTDLYGPASTLLAVERAAREVGYGVTLFSLVSLDESSVRGAVDALADQAVDGLVLIVPRTTAGRGLHGLRSTLPVVLVEAGAAGGRPVVSVDQFTGARLATDHLLSLGHRTVWHVAGPADWMEAQERAEGWRASLADAHAISPPLLHGDWSPESGYKVGLDLAQTPGVTAVFAANDQMALGILHALNERRIRVPRDISVVGFDDIPAAAYLIPALTTVRQDFNEVGRRGLKLLVTMMNEPAGDATPPARVQPKLIVRKSTARPRTTETR